MTFLPSSQNHVAVITLHNMSRHFTLRNCIVSATPVTSGSSGINLVKTIPNNVEGQNNDSCTIEGNQFSGGYIALYLGGTSYVALSKERGLIVRNNTITDAGSKGIYVTDEENILIENNTITTSQTTKTGYIGIDLFRNRGNIVVSNNKIVNNQSVYSTGINLRQELMGTAAQPALVSNNVIAITASKSSGYGIDISSDCQFIRLYHNSVNLNGTGGYVFGISKTYTTISNIDLKNNLFQNNTSSPVFFFRAASTAHLAACTFSNNVYYSTDGAISNSHSDLMAWNTASGDENSIVGQAAFVSTTNLHLSDVGSLNMGLTLPEVPTDADGSPRKAANPTVGAYEMAGLPTANNQVEASADKLVLYPSLADNEIFIAATIDFNRLRVYSVLGRLVLDATQAAHARSLDVSSLQSGHYVLVVSDSAGKSQSARFVKR